jgi:hypothetical protein
MSINFPNNPQINDIYTLGDSSWQWNGVTWDLKPFDIPTSSDVIDIFNTPATAGRLGTIRVGSGLSITANGTLSADAFQAVTGFNDLQFLSFTTGVSINEFSSDVALAGNANNAVPTERAVKTYVDSSINAIDLDANGIIATGNIQEVAFYQANGKTLRGNNKLKWDSNLETLLVENITVTDSLSSNTLSTNSLELLGSGTVSGNLLVSGDVSANSVFNEGLGIAKFEFGADLIFDALGDINVSGSKITNLGTPTASTDAVNKAYVDGAAAQFTGGDVPNAVRILSTTASSSSTTGALIVAGGIGVAGELYAGGSIYVNGSPVLTSLSGGFNGGTISGTLFVNNNTASSSTTTGAIRITGGAGIGRSIYAGGDSYFNGIRFGNGAAIGAGFAQNVSIGGGTGINSPLSSNISGVNDIAIGFSSLGQLTGGSDNIAIGYQAMANRLSGERSIAIGSSSLIDCQGNNNIGIGHEAGLSLFNGDGNVIIGNNSGSGIDNLNNHIIISDGQGNIRLQFNNSGAWAIGGTSYGNIGQVLTSNGSTGAPTWAAPSSFNGGTITGTLFVNESTASNATTTGALVVSGGVGIGGNLNVGGTFTSNGIQNTAIGSITRNTGAFTTLTSNSTTTFTAGTVSSSTTTGTIVVTGGAGFSGAVNIGGSLSAGGVSSFTSNTASSGTTTGSLLVTGGIGVSGRVSAANFNGAEFTASSGTYGGASILGEKNGWAGLNFRSSAGVNANTIMSRVSDGYGGIFNKADSNWLLQWDGSGNFTATANVTAYSDERLKDQIEIIPNALEKVLTLDGVTFIRRDNGQRGTGLIAQNLQKVLPEAVLEDEKGMLSVAYGNTVGLLIEAIKEQQKQIDLLTQKLIKLEGRE